MQLRRQMLGQRRSAGFEAIEVEPAIVRARATRTGDVGNAVGLERLVGYGPGAMLMPTLVAFWLAILLALTLSDFLSRGWLPIYR